MKSTKNAFKASAFSANNKAEHSPFSKDTSFKVLEIIEALDFLSTREEFIEVIRMDIRKLIPHDMSIFGIGEWKTFRIDGLINIDYPEKNARSARGRSSGARQLVRPLRPGAGLGRAVVNLRQR